MGTVSLLWALATCGVRSEVLSSASLGVGRPEIRTCLSLLWQELQAAMACSALGLGADTGTPEMCMLDVETGRREERERPVG